MWRRDEQADQPYALKLTAAGAKTFAIDDGSASNETREDISQHLQGAAPKQPSSACGAPLWVKMVAARAGLSDSLHGRSC